MIRRATLLVAVLAGILAGCATLKSALRPGQDERFEAGVSALAKGDYTTARNDLNWVAQHYPQKAVGQRALLILAAVEMDPRNPDRSLDTGADMAASFLRLTERDRWVDPVAQTLYLQAMELGDAEDRVQQAEAQQTRELPKLPGPSVTARIKTVEQDRDRLAKRVAALEAQLADKDRELDRIKRTIKP